MYRFAVFSLFLALLISFFSGCTTTKIFFKGGLADEELYSQTSPESREAVKKAKFDLDVAREKDRLAEMKVELSSLEKELSSHEKDLTEKLLEEAEHAVDIAKLEAISNAGLGKLKKNAENTQKLKNMNFDSKSKRIKIKADMAIIKRKIERVSQKITTQEKLIEDLTS